MFHTDLDLRVGERPVLHDLRRAQLVAAVDQGHLGGELGEEDGLLDGGVAAADHGDLLAAEEEAVAGGAGGHAVAEQALLRCEAEHQALGAGGDDDRRRPVVLGVVADPDLERALAEVDRGRPSR